MVVWSGLESRSNERESVEWWNSGDENGSFVVQWVGAGNQEATK
jgi:hypothetical protein